MRDHLMDLVGHTFDLGVIDLVKIIGTEQETRIETIGQDLTVVVKAKFAGPVAEFMGEFGMPNLGKLKILLNLDEYRENAKLTIKHKESGTPDGINFENAVGDFRNTYKFMSSEIVNGKLQTIKFKTPTWHIEFEPTVAAIQRLRMQAQANAEETTFQARTDGGHLKFFFGYHSSHAGNFVFQHDVSGQLKRAWAWPVNTVISILSLTGDKTFRISDDGAAMITVDSGVGVYNYILPAQSK